MPVFPCLPLALSLLLILPLGAAAAPRGPADARATIDQVAVPRCEDGEVSAESQERTMKDGPEAPKDEQAGTPEAPTGTPAFPTKNPFLGRLPKPSAFWGLSGPDKNIAGGPYLWHVVTAVKVAGTSRAGDPVSKATHLRIGLFAKPDGTLWYGTAESDYSQRVPYLPPPCGLQLMSRTPDFSRILNLDNGARYVGELDANDQRHGFGVFQNARALHIGFWQHGKPHGWGVQRSAATYALSPKGYAPESDLASAELANVRAGTWEEGRLVHGHQMIADHHLQEVDLAKLRGKRLPFYAGDFGPDGYPRGLGVGLNADWIAVGAFDKYTPIEGLVLARTLAVDAFAELRKRNPTHEQLPAAEALIWAGWKNELTVLPAKTYRQLASGDVVLTPRWPVPLVVLDGPAGNLPVMTEGGALYESETFALVSGPPAATAQARAKDLRSSPGYSRLARLRAGENAKAAQTARSAEINAHNARIMAERAAMQAAFAAEIRASNNQTFVMPSGSAGARGQSSSTQNYETRRSSAVMAERQWKQDFARDVNRIGKRY